LAMGGGACTYDYCNTPKTSRVFATVDQVLGSAVEALASANATSTSMPLRIQLDDVVVIIGPVSSPSTSSRIAAKMLPVTRAPQSTPPLP
jgi:hypothetical protein